MSDRIPITNIGETPAGDSVERSLMGDFRTLDRWAGWALRYLGDERGTELIMPGVSAYNQCDYASALASFNAAIAEAPELEGVLLHTHILFCRRVLDTELDLEDISWTQRDKPGRLSQMLGKDEAEKQRCKWCGHYTFYEDPRFGDGWAGENTCTLCAEHPRGGVDCASVLGGPIRGPNRAKLRETE